MTKTKLAVLLGFLVGAPLGLVGGTVASVVVRAAKHAELRRGWNGASVLVSRRNLAAGAPTGLDDVEPRSVAESLVTSAHLKGTDFGFVVDKRTRVAVKPGQPLEWSFFDTVPPERLPAREACIAAIDAKRGSAR